MSNDSKIEKLTKDNFDTWKIQCEALLTKHDFWGHIDGTTPIPQDDDWALGEWLRNDKKAKADIILSISPSEVRHITQK